MTAQERTALDDDPSYADWLSQRMREPIAPSPTYRSIAECRATICADGTGRSFTTACAPSAATVSRTLTEAFTPLARLVVYRWRVKARDADRSWTIPRTRGEAFWLLLALVGTICLALLCLYAVMAMTGGCQADVNGDCLNDTGPLALSRQTLLFLVRAFAVVGSATVAGIGGCLAIMADRCML